MDTFFGRSWDQWIHEYSQSHQHPANQFCHKLGIPAIALSLIVAPFSLLLPGLFYWCLGLFILGWILQFVGHVFERKWPEFFRDWRFLFVGLRWWWSKVRPGRSNTG